MRRLPKQLICLNGSGVESLSTRRSKEWRVQLASTMRSIASAVPPPAAASTDEAAAKAAYLARLDAEPPFYTKKQVVAGATLASTMRSIASMASAMPLPAATSTDEQLPKPLVLLECEQSRLSTRRSKEWWVKLWPRQCVRLLRWLRRCHCRLRRVPMSSCQSRLSCSNASRVAFLHEEARSGG